MMGSEAPVSLTSGQSFFANRVAGCLFSLAIGAGVVIGITAIVSDLGRILADSYERQAVLFQIALAVSPFALLTICGIDARRPWLVGLAWTLMFWGYYWYSVETYNGGGADIGLGFIMMLSPLIVALAAMLAVPRTRSNTGDSNARDD